jgi:glycosyltransferase involved in cell wall biosynthesis
MLLTPSAFHRALHLANGVAPDRIVVNKNGIAPPAPRPRARSDEDPLRFGFVGGAGPIKGIELIRRAFEALPDANYELVLVDNTLNLGYSSIEVEDWRVRGRIRVVPAYSQAELDDFFACIDVLLFPSQWKESFGLTVREALARDVWVIATDAGGAAEDIVEGENGVVVPIGDDEGPLREAIASLLHHPERLSGYENPYKGRLVTVDDQAARLASLLREAAGSAAG